VPIRLLLILAALVAVSCNKAPQNKDAIRQGIVEHVAKNSGLDVSSMDIEVGNVTFRDKQAEATVSFRPKGAPDQGMTMSYTLEAKGNKWVVLKRAGAGAGAGHGEPKTEMPSGHPPVSGQEKLPEGHPPVGKTK
jgi:hypothetical protein